MPAVTAVSSSGLADAFAAEPLAAPPEQKAVGQDDEDADGGGGCRREEPDAEAQDDAPEDHRHRGQAQERQAARGGVHRRGGRRRLGLQAGDDDDDGDEREDGDEAGDDGGLEHLDDRALDDHRVDDQRHRGRDQDAQGAAGRQRAGGQPGLVAHALELGQRHAPHGRGGGQRGAAHRPEAGAGADGGDGHPAAEAPDQGVDPLEEVAAEVGVGGQVAHQHEQRHHRKVVVGDRVPQKRLELPEVGLEAQERHGEAQGIVAADADRHHGDADRYAQHEEREQHHDAGDADEFALTHRRPSRRPGRRPPPPT